MKLAYEEIVSKIKDERLQQEYRCEESKLLDLSQQAGEPRHHHDGSSLKKKRRNNKKKANKKLRMDSIDASLVKAAPALRKDLDLVIVGELCQENRAGGEMEASNLGAASGGDDDGGLVGWERTRWMMSKVKQRWRRNTATTVRKMKKVRSKLTSLDNIVPPNHGFMVSSTSMRNVWLSMEHQAILWCNQLVVQAILFQILKKGLQQCSLEYNSLKYSPYLLP
ncbi:hypothetical protein K1719_046510 [Acacia pycnantha]|nr:hypothetical protein K1719_046510 [Acacia pycnantha]